MLLALAVYMLVWTVYGTIAKGSQGLHPDMTELIAWSRDLAWGYKHPPLAAAIVRLWFTVFPVAEWSYYLLAMLMPTMALWIVWRLSADYLDIEKRVIGVALLMLVPFYNFHALKYNVNTVLLPTWAATTLWFLRSYKTHSVFYAALAGLGAAGCMLGKYWSVFLIGGLVIAALVDGRRARYFRSTTPWITVLAGLAALAPHLLWLSGHYELPFSYALVVHSEKSFVTVMIGALGYLAGSAGYVAVPAIIVLAIARPGRAVIADAIWPKDTDRRLAAAAFWAPLLLPAFVAPVADVEITSLWSMSAWTLLPVLLLSSPAISVRAHDTERILVAAIVFPLVMLMASPVIALLDQRKGPSPVTAQASLLATQVERAWHAVTAEPLRYVGGDAELAPGVAAYAADRPLPLFDVPPPSAARLAQAGVALVCFAEDQQCRGKTAAQASRLGSSRVSEVTLARSYLGLAGRPRRYVIWIVPPRR